MQPESSSNAEADQPEPGTVTRLLQKMEAGDARSREVLFELVYPYLRHAAARALQHERSDHTFQPTDLLHEAYIRLVIQDKATAQNRAHFFGICGRCMRHILVDYARTRNAQKRGGNLDLIRLHELNDLPGIADTDHILMLNMAIEQLNKIDAPRAQLAEMRLFAGLSLEEAAAALNTTYSTTRRRWEATRIWLQGHLNGKDLR